MQALVISELDYCNATLAGLPACVVRPFGDVAAGIQLKSLTLAYRTATGSAPAYLNIMIQLYSSSVVFVDL